MTIRWLLAAAHLLALGIGLGAIWGRARAFGQPLDAAGLKRLFDADTWWGVAAGLWILTGLVRAFGPFEKGSGYYLHNHFFLLKMGLLALILVLEIAPMVTLIKWRVALKKRTTLDTSHGAGFARTSMIQAGLVVLMVLAATAMARGYDF